MCGTPVYSSALTCPSCGTDLTRAGAVFSSSDVSSTPVDWKKRRRTGVWIGFVAVAAVALAGATVGRPWVGPFAAPGMIVAKAATKTASQWAQDSVQGLRKMVGLSQRSSQKPQANTPKASSPQPVKVIPPAVPAVAAKPASALIPVVAPPAPAATAPSATLIISSTPRGARVQIDGVARGVTPLTVSQVRAGLHRVRISHKGYRPVLRTITVQPGKRIALGVSLPVQPTPAAAKPAPRPAPSPTAAPLELGKVAPQFTAKDRVGVIYRTADYRGQKLLLVFVQTLDANAQRIVRELNAIRAGGTREAVVVVVLRPDRAAIRKFVQTEQIQVPVLFGTQQLARAYGVAGQPAVLYLVAEDGRVAARQVGRVNPGAVLN
jgi:peroxiredoxin